MKFIKDLIQALLVFASVVVINNAVASTLNHSTVTYEYHCCGDTMTHSNSVEVITGMDYPRGMFYVLYEGIEPSVADATLRFEDASISLDADSFNRDIFVKFTFFDAPKILSAELSLVGSPVSDLLHTANTVSFTLPAHSQAAIYEVNLSLAPVPEPDGIGLMIAGLMVILLRRVQTSRRRGVSVTSHGPSYTASC